jgi:hypothetical protein
MRTVGIQYAAPAPNSVASVERLLEMPLLRARAHWFVPVFVMLTCAGPLAAQQATTTGNQSPAVVGNATINYNNMTPEQIRQVVEQVLEATKGKSAPAVGPGTEQQVGQAVTAIAKGASEGDDQLQKALSLLAAGNVAQAGARSAQILSRHPGDHRPFGAVRPQQRWLAARSRGDAWGGRRGAGGAGQPAQGAQILPRHPGDQGNQSPAVNSGGNVGIQYGTPPSSGAR